MQLAELVREGERVMTVCNSCRYCEQYCPMFPALERRLTFTSLDLTYLANLCHNCGECLYACQYAPPHEFGIDVPRTLAKLRLVSYEEYCWPRFLAGAFRRQGPFTALAAAGGLAAVMLAGAWLFDPESLWQHNPAGNFYSVVPYAIMNALFGGVSLFVVSAMGIGMLRFWRDVQGGDIERPQLTTVGRGLREALTLKHLHATGVDCTTSEEARSPWRRHFHHCTLYGFMLCFASTCVAALYHNLFQWQAPYGYTSLPVLLGTVGGVGLLVGPCGLLVLQRRRDAELTDPAQRGLDQAFIWLLFLTSLTGLLLLGLRDTALMSVILIVHLALVLALLLTLPYGKFVHGLYRTAALIRHAIESDRETN